jgi:hypothetical protein
LQHRGLMVIGNQECIMEFTNTIDGVVQSKSSADIHGKKI